MPTSFCNLSKQLIWLPLVLRSDGWCFWQILQEGKHSGMQTQKRQDSQFHSLGNLVYYQPKNQNKNDWRLEIYLNYNLKYADLEGKVSASNNYQLIAVSQRPIFSKSHHKMVLLNNQRLELLWSVRRAFQTSYVSMGQRTSWVYH